MMKRRGERVIGKPCDRCDPGAKSKSNPRGQDWCLPCAAWLAFYFVVRCCSFGHVYEMGEMMDGKRGGKGRKGKGKGYQGCARTSNVLQISDTHTDTNCPLMRLCLVRSPK